MRTEVRADKLYPNGTVYNLHHIYDFHNYNYYYENNYPNVFEVRDWTVLQKRLKTCSGM